MRLLPIVIFATTSLLVLKLVGLTTGAGSFAIGPEAAQAASEAPEAEPSPTVPAPLEVDPFLEQPVDLAREAEELRKKKAEAGHGADAAPAGGNAHGEAGADAGGHSDVAAEGGHGETPADAAKGAAPAEGGHGETPADAAKGEAPAEGGHGETPAEGGHGETPADASKGEAPAEGGHGGAPAEGSASGLSTTRPAEYKPPESTTERAILESLAERRRQLDQRETDIDMRLKLLQAAEDRINKRLDELKSIESQLGGGAGEDGSASAPAAGSASAAAPEADEQMKALVSLYENMKPAAAAAVFEKLEGATLVALAKAMSPRKLSPIMALMSPDKAGKLTVALAGAQGPREVVVRVEDSQANPPSTQSVRGDLPKILPMRQ